MKSCLYKKILIIEDDEMFSSPLMKFLTYNEFQVNLATNAIDGIELQKNIAFDLIITDLNMDGMNGRQVIKKIIERYPHSRIIVISGYIGDDQEFQDIRENSHVDAVFEKPVMFPELLSTIKKIL